MSPERYKKFKAIFRPGSLFRVSNSVRLFTSVGPQRSYMYIVYIKPKSIMMLVDTCICHTDHARTVDLDIYEDIKLINGPNCNPFDYFTPISYVAKVLIGDSYYLTYPDNLLKYFENSRIKKIPSHKTKRCL